MNRERVLVVDDSAPNRMVACGHLEAAGYEVVAVGSGEAALELLGREDVTRFDLVVLDVLMPGLGGLATCRRLRGNPATTELPVLFLTALDDKDATEPALEAGGDDLLPKPFQRAELLLRVRALIRQRRTTLRLREATHELAAQNEALRRAEVGRRRMSELIVHDLKSPASAIAVNAELLRHMKLGGELAEIAEDILVAAHQIDRTARDLLDVSRAEDGTLEVEREDIDLAELAGEVAATLRGAARWTGLTIEIVARAPTAIGDRELVRRILQNLVHNALRYAPRDTVVRVETEAEPGGVVLRVLDEGPGVPPGDADRIFERNVSLDDTGRGGHGLGLAFCRLAAEAQGGRIWVEARVPRGAAFCVRIPAP
ncbi:MAG TPA: hybrid sensor histidine kinase/response regulator [Kofleriaceae bacterium]